MSKAEEREVNIDDFEEVEVRPRQNRGAVISVRLSSDDAQRFAEMAEHTGLSVSELARRTIRQAIHTPWRLFGFGSTVGAVVIVGSIQYTGGDYGPRLEPVDTNGQWGSFAPCCT
ncbi:MAG: ribbon-helix-helix protein, CopG family [Solirubrobacteraceae bacterium]